MPANKKQTTTQRLLLTVPDVAILLGVCPATVYNLMYREGLPSVKMGYMRRFYLESVQEWAKQREIV